MNGEEPTDPSFRPGEGPSQPGRLHRGTVASTALPFGQMALRAFSAMAPVIMSRPVSTGCAESVASGIYWRLAGSVSSHLASCSTDC